MLNGVHIPYRPFLKQPTQWPQQIHRIVQSCALLMFQQFVPQRRAPAKHSDARLQSLNLEGWNGRTESLRQVWATYQTLSEEGRKKRNRGRRRRKKEKQKIKENPGMMAHAYSPYTSLEVMGGSLATWRVLDHPGLYEALSNSSKGTKGPPPPVLWPLSALRQPLRAFGPPHSACSGHAHPHHRQREPPVSSSCR